MKKIYLINIIALMFISCSEYIDPIDTTLQPGHIYCNDGTLLHPTEFINSKKKAVGVVFWVNDGKENTTLARGYAVSLEDLPALNWADTSEHIPDVTTNERDFSGSANTAAIISFSQKENVPTPAAMATVNYKPGGVTGWYLPSIGQLKAIFTMKEKIYKSLEITGGERFINTWYWSSTEDGEGKNNIDHYALIYSLPEGIVNNSRKENVFSIRPIISIR